jgi:hypothetical protein
MLSQSPCISRQHAISSAVSSASGSKQAMVGDAKMSARMLQARTLDNNFTNLKFTPVLFHSQMPDAFVFGLITLPVTPSRGIRSAGYALVNVKKNVDPWPMALSTRTLPPWFSTMCFTMAKPRPVPPVSRERALSTR